MGQSALRHNDTSITNNILNSKEETFQGVKSNKDSYESDIGYADNDLVFREYSWGYRLEKGYEILIEQDKIIGEVENTQDGGPPRGDEELPAAAPQHRG